MQNNTDPFFVTRQVKYNFYKSYEKPFPPFI